MYFSTIKIVFHLELYFLFSFCWENSGKQRRTDTHKAKRGKNQVYMTSHLNFKIEVSNYRKMIILWRQGIHSANIHILVNDQNRN